jgi:2'-5' RNA ligase
MPVRKYFIAIVIPPPHRGEIEAVKEELHREHGLKGALRSPAHITLHRPFEWKEEKEQVLTDKLSQFTFKDDFEIALRDYGFFPPRVIFAAVVPDPALESLHDALALFAKRELNLHNETGDERGFHPHVTVAFRDLRKQKFFGLRPLFESRKLSAVFRYQGFSLLKLEDRWEELKFFPS